jgi:predicted dehydrogenase
MADTWADSQRMAEAAADSSVQLTFNHQRRFGPRWQRAGELLEEGAIGDLTRVGIGGKNLYDYGTHLIDLVNGYNGERGAEWVLGQVHYDDENVRYGVHNENQAVALWGYDNGVHAFTGTGSDTGSKAMGCHVRLVGTEGTIEVNPDTDAYLRYRSHDTDGWLESKPESDTHDITRAIEHVLATLGTGEDNRLSAERALRATEIIFSAWESARTHQRIDLPLEFGGNALTEMVESGDLTPS